MTWHGRIENGVVVFPKSAAAIPPNGTLVAVTPVQYEIGSPAAVLAAMAAEPHLTPEDIAELDQAISAASRPAETIEPFSEDAPGPF